MRQKPGRVLIMGLSFKENCPDMRNSKVIDLIKEIEEFGIEVDVHDPWVDASKAKTAFGIDLVSKPDAGNYDAVIVAVKHREFIEMGIETIRGYTRDSGIVFDMKNAFDANAADLRL